MRAYFHLLYSYNKYNMGFGAYTYWGVNRGVIMGHVRTGHARRLAGGHARERTHAARTNAERTNAARTSALTADKLARPTRTTSTRNTPKRSTPCNRHVDTALPCFTCPARQSELCSAMDDAHIQKLFSLAYRKHIDKGQYLFMEEAPSKYVYNITQGVIMLERIASDGRRQVISFSYPGEFIGLMVGKNYNIAARALTQAKLCRWDMRDLERLFTTYPALERQMRVIANRVLATTIDQVFILGRKNASEKLAFFLLQNYERQNKISLADIAMHDTARPLISLPMSRTDIADHLGMTIETTSRAFSKFVRDGLIRRKTHTQIELIDLHGLKDAAESCPA